MSIENIYGEKLRQLEAENISLKKRIKAVESVIFQSNNKDTVFSIIHKIKLALLKK